MEDINFILVTKQNQALKLKDHNESYILLQVISHEGQVSNTVFHLLFDIHNNDAAIFVILGMKVGGDLLASVQQAAKLRAGITVNVLPQPFSQIPCPTCNAAAKHSESHCKNK